MKKVQLEGVRWLWVCYEEDSEEIECEHYNWIDDNEIFWDDTTPVVWCEKCKTKYEVQFPK